MCASLHVEDVEYAERRIKYGILFIFGITAIGKMRTAQVPERVSTTSIVVLRLENSRVESLRRTGHL